MDIMMRLTGSGFSAIANEFRAREKRLGGGLPLLDFVEIVLPGLPRARSAEEKVANISALVDLFEDIDINGDGVMEFDEFTSFCVDAGMVATRAKAATLKHRYVRDTRHVIKTANGSMGIEKVKWSPECRKFMVIEHAAKAVKLFAADGKFIAEVGMPVASGNNIAAAASAGSGVESGGAATPGEYERPSKGDKLQGSPSGRMAPTGSATSTSTANSISPGAATGNFVLDAVFVPKFHWLVTSTTDFSISFFDMDESRNAAIGRVLPEAAAAKSSASFELIKPLTITTATAQLLLRFCSHSNLLVGSGNDFVINIWKIVDGENKVLWKRLLTHQDMVMDFLEVPQHDLLVSCDLRRCIQLWETQNCRSRGSLVGHSRGVRQIVYSSHHDLLLSAGFEFEAYAWDLGSRQIVMKLAGHRAPLVGVQLALFQTERAITADVQGVFKVWDISRNSGTYGSATSSSSSRQGGGLVGSTTHAIQLESIEPALQFARFEPMTFVCLHPLSRDVWTSTAGSSTLHRFQSKRIQQFDEIPLSGFYLYNANKFVVVTGSVCSVWDGESGTCTEEFTHVGNVGAADFDRDNPARGGDSSGAEGGGTGEAGKGNNHNGAEKGQAQEPTSEVLVCTHDAKCRKLVVVSELGFMGVFNCLNFVQMRQCLERFNGMETSSAASPSLATSRSASSRIVGMHYCSDNKLVVATDASTSAIMVIEDNVSHDSANGAKRTPVLRRVVNIPGGIAASAYSYHASVIATVAESDGMLLALWDFETLTLIAQCHFDDDDDIRDGDGGTTANRIQLLQFWDEFPVLFAADSLGHVFVFAVMPLIHAYAGKLLHVFENCYSARSGGENVDSDGVDESRGTSDLNGVVAESILSARAGESAVSSSGNAASNTFITEVAESAAQKLLLRSRQKKLGSISGASSHHGEASTEGAKQVGSSEASSSSSLSLEPQRSASKPSQSVPTTTVSSAVTSMKITFDDSDDRYILFTGDENGHIAVWDLSAMTRQLMLTKIPEIKRKCMRRGYHPKATFSRDYAKEGKPVVLPRERRHHQPVFQGDWRRSMLLGEDMADMDVRAAQMDLKRLSKRRIETRKRATTTTPGSTGPSKQQQQFMPSPVPSGPTSQAKSQAGAAVDSAVAAAEAFLGGGQRKSVRNIPVVSKRKPSSDALLSSSPSSATGSSAMGTESFGSLKDSPSSNRAGSSSQMLVKAVCRWQAHRDEVTSIEVTRNPNILVTCSLDTRVFVWNWCGECLGKLFDAENIGGCRWRFHKSDAKRQHERDQVVRDIMRELELTPREKLHRRRQTLYEEHVGRRSQAELKHVNAMLLDHIISKNPELEVMEKTVYTARDGADTGTAGESLSSGAYPGDAEVNAVLERTRQRNHRAKLTMLTKLQGAVALTSKRKPGGRSANTLEVAALKQAALRMKSLSQVGPLLCVNRFDYRNQPTDSSSSNDNSRPSTGASVPAFTDHGDIRMDKAYLEQEFTISSESTSQSSSNNSSVVVVQNQIQAEHLAAEAVVEHRATLERKARELYSNLEATKRRLGKEKRSLPSQSQSASSLMLLGVDPTLPLSAANLLEPSEFLKKHLPLSVLALRPQTAPLHRVSSSTPKREKTSQAQLSSSSSSAASLPAPVSKKTQRQLPRAGSAGTKHSLHGSESEPELAGGARGSPAALSSSTKAGGSSVPAYNTQRKNSLNELFLDEVNRLSSSPMRLSSFHIQEDTTQVPSNGEVSHVTTDVDGVGGSPHHQHNSTKSSLQKLVGINKIISRVHHYGSALTKDQDLLGSGDHGPSCSRDSDPAVSAVDEETIRQHLEVTKDRMMAAMHDGEWPSSHRHLVKKQRQAALQQKKARRMEDYLQQKRREMNTSIGNVFKHTSFAFQSSASDDAQSHSADRTGRRRAVSSASSSPIKSGEAGGGRRKSKNAKGKDKKQSAFGIYSAREVMSVIRLFWVMDEDASGNISLDELLQYKHFFEKLGHSDMATVFQAIDKDGNGQVSLRELLETCFHYATKYQVEEMLKLAKLGSVRLYLQGGELSSDGGESGSANASAGAAKNLPAEHRRELMQIFKLFDSNGDGGVSMQEIMEALRVDDDDVMAAVMTKERSKDGGTGGLLTSGITRDDVEQFYREFDRDSDAVLDFDEFVALMRSLYGPRVSPHQ